jgi:hypothetical protein
LTVNNRQKGLSNIGCKNIALDGIGPRRANLRGVQLLVLYNLGRFERLLQSGE